MADIQLEWKEYPAGMERQLQNVVIFTKVGQQNKRIQLIKSTFKLSMFFYPR